LPVLNPPWTWLISAPRCRRSAELAAALPVGRTKSRTAGDCGITEAKVTTDHDTIRKWAEARRAKPATVRSTHRKDDPGIIRLEFPGAPNANDDALEEISWDEFFEKFDEAGLALLYQEETADGQRSNFNKLVGRETAEAREHGDNKASRRRGR
jgi:hypothetical protein